MLGFRLLVHLLSQYKDMRVFFSLIDQLTKLAHTNILSFYVVNLMASYTGDFETSFVP